MIDEIGKIDFDVAILGCGAYGLPLAAAIKGMGKQAIHLGRLSENSASTENLKNDF
jgi:threonine dehydrogenase-like Zn-dependent dehydrogenase